MHGTNSESSLAAYRGAGPRGRRAGGGRPGAAVIAAVAAVLAGLGVAGCQGAAPSSAAPSNAAPSSAARSPVPSGAGQSSVPAPAPLEWSPARAPLPADTNGVSGQYVSLSDVSCQKAGNCVAVGFDKASGDVTQGVAETLSDGAWTPTAVPAVSSKKGIATLSAVTCLAQGTCVAVGFLTSAAGGFTPVIETLSGGHWDPAKPPLPGDALPTASATLNDVSCPAAGTCVATGWYSNASGLRQGYVDTLANGTWKATSAPLPADAAPEQYSSTSTASTYLAAVACTGVGACVASGEYRDVHAQTRAVIDTLSGGAWTATTAPLPADASATGQVAALWAIDCPATGTCVAAGHYIERGGQPRFLTDTLSGGRWTTSALSLPADAAADQKWSQEQATTVGGLACESVGYCVATAGYVTKTNVIAPLIETLSGGTWTAVKAPLPPDAATGSGPQNAAYLDLDTCPGARSCLIVGSYPAADGTVEGLIETAVARHG
jgi:hypothetical protein